MMVTQEDKHEKAMTDGSSRLFHALWRDHSGIMTHLGARPVSLEPGKVYKTTLASQTPRQRMHDV